jgi:hypothetical protein
MQTEIMDMVTKSEATLGVSTNAGMGGEPIKSLIEHSVTIKITNAGMHQAQTLPIAPRSD